MLKHAKDEKFTLNLSFVHNMKEDVKKTCEVDQQKQHPSFLTHILIIELQLS